MRKTFLLHAPRALALSAVLAVVPGAGLAQEPAASDVWERVPDSLRVALDRITPQSLSGDLSFIASDLLEGRDTPSRGQEVAAQYIAAQFRGAGLEAVGDDGYFQTADWLVRGRASDAFSASITAAGRTIALKYGQVTIFTDDELSLHDAPLIRIAASAPEALETMDAEALKGAVVLTDLPNFRTLSLRERGDAFRAMQALLPGLAQAGVAAVISIDRASEKGSGFGSGELIDPQSPQSRGRGFRVQPPLLWSHDPAVAELFDSLENGPATAAADLVLGPPHDERARLCNVVGMLRGSDETLRDEYVIVTAHYDHLGIGSPVEGDSIFNGANDDGSGTVSVIALARALASLPEADRPARSILFMTVFGEEKGMLGSQYYAAHPIVPLEKTIANLNLEQVGRTDSTEGPQIGRASLTGFAYSTLADSLVEAGGVFGVEVFNHPANSESFFGRSDNVVFASRGIPAHTLCVAYEYPDYHARGDHWEKVDYENLSRIDRMAALGLYLLADGAEGPKWREDHPRAGRYVEAWRKLKGIEQP